MAVTLKLLAERTGKSITTVSRALAGYDDVSEETKELVRRVANELRYTPNFLARSLQKRRSRTISLILPTVGPRFSDPFFSEFLTGVANMAAERGYDLLLSVQAPGEGEMELYRRKDLVVVGVLTLLILCPLALLTPFGVSGASR